MDAALNKLAENKKTMAENKKMIVNNEDQIDDLREDSGEPDDLPVVLMRFTVYQ